MTTSPLAPVYAGPVPALYTWLRCHPRLVDCLLAFPLGAAGLAVMVARGWLLMVPVVLALTVPLVFRRTHPVATYGVAIAAGAAQVVSGRKAGVSDLAILILLYSLAAYTPRRTSVAGLAVCLAGCVTAVLTWPPMPHFRLAALLGGAVMYTGPALAAWILGDSMRYRRAYYAGLEDRAARLERERDAQAQIAVAAERARIARELHDVVAHNVSVMVVQADGASYALDSDPERTRQALGAIADTGRQALAEMRRLLGVLRREATQTGLTPLPGVEELAELLDQARAAGLPVDFQVAGEPRPVASGAALAAYRIVQESLTNTRKHAGPRAAATVTLRYCESALVLTIADDGRGTAAITDGAGHGLTGMRERVSLYGGALTAGPRPGGGFEVTAVLPLAAPGVPAPAEGTGWRQPAAPGVAEADSSTRALGSGAA